MDQVNLETFGRLIRKYGSVWIIKQTHRLLKLIEIIGEGLEYDREASLVAAYLRARGFYSPRI